MLRFPGILVTDVTGGVNRLFQKKVTLFLSIFIRGNLTVAAFAWFRSHVGMPSPIALPKIPVRPKIKRAISRKAKRENLKKFFLDREINFCLILSTRIRAIISFFQRIMAFSMSRDPMCLSAITVRHSHFMTA